MRRLERRLPACTSWIAPGASNNCGRSASGSAVVPPFAWPMMSQPSASTSSIVTGEESGIDAPPVWFMTTNPAAWAARTSGAASACGWKSPKPTFASQTPLSANSAKSPGSRSGSMITAPPSTLTPPGRKPAKARCAATRQRLDPLAVVWPAWQMHLGGGHHHRHAAVHRGLDPAQRRLARGPVAEDHVGVGVDQARDGDRARRHRGPCRRRRGLEGRDRAVLDPHRRRRRACASPSDR